MIEGQFSEVDDSPWYNFQELSENVKYAETSGSVLDRVLIEHEFIVGGIWVNSVVLDWRTGSYHPYGNKQ